MKAYSGSRCIVLQYLISVLDGGQWSQPRPYRFTPGNDPVPTVQEAGWPHDWSGWVQKSLPTPRFDPRTVQPVASRVKQLKILGFCMFRQHYSAVSNTVTESTCRSQSKRFYFVYVRSTSPHRPIGSNIVTACTCVSNSKFVKLMYTCAASMHVVCDKVRVNTSQQLKVCQVFLANKREKILAQLC